jgi:Zn-dependent peptidase ImmA (M78 family)
MRLAKDFIKFTIKELDMKTLPANIKFADGDYASQHLTFGTYNPSTDEIVIVKGKRHPVDVLRTLAHELIHHKQREDGKELNGEDGSDIENEANARAGELLRRYRKLHPEIFSVGPLELHTNIEENKMNKIIEAAKTGVPQQIDEQYLDGYTALMLVSVLQKLSPENRKKFMSESINKMVTIAYKIVTQ